MCETPSVYREQAYVARKAHVCEECGRIIVIGELYQSVWGVWEGRGETFGTRAECWEVREDLSEDMPRSNGTSSDRG